LIQAQQTEKRKTLKAESLRGHLCQQYDFLHIFPNLPEEQCTNTKQNVVEWMGTWEGRKLENSLKSERWLYFWWLFVFYIMVWCICS